MTKHRWQILIVKLLIDVKCLCGNYTGNPQSGKTWRKLPYGLYKILYLGKPNQQWISIEVYRYAHENGVPFRIQIHCQLFSRIFSLGGVRTGDQANVCFNTEKFFIHLM